MMPKNLVKMLNMLYVEQWKSIHRISDSFFAARLLEELFLQSEAVVY